MEWILNCGLLTYGLNNIYILYEHAMHKLKDHFFYQLLRNL